MNARRIFALFLVLPLLLFTTCKDEVVHRVTYRTQIPVYLSVSAVRAQPVVAEAPRELARPGKIYVYGDYLLISEANQGIHIVDNSNPSSPRHVSFINIPGNSDMAVNSNRLYADHYVDLLTFDISNPASAKLVKRVQDVFDSQYIDKQKGLVTGFKDTVISTTSTSQIYNSRNREYASDNAFYSNTSVNQSYGTGGSTARFTLMNSSLYTVDHQSLRLFNVSDPANPEFVNRIELGWGIETIFPYRDKLFIGSTTGMHIYDAADPAAPVKLSVYEHVTSCDPVVVQGNYAYVTLRSDNSCRFGSNLLDVVDVENPANPKLVSSFPMLNPHGLTVTAKNLYICEGNNGLKSFDHSDVKKIGEKQLAFITDVDALDVIAGPKSLIVTGEKGVYQYEYTNPAELKLLSRITLSDPLP